MKRILYFLAVAVFSFAAGISVDALSAGDTVTVELPRFDITLNGERVDTRGAEYPIVVYRDIAYIPVSDKGRTDYNYLQYLGIDCGESRSYSVYKKLFLRNMFFERDFPDRAEFKEHDGNAASFTAVVSENRNIIINRFGDVREYVTDRYPMLTMEGADYIPMTYRLAHECLGLEYSFSAEKGLSLSRADIPEKIVSVPSFDITLVGVRYPNDRARYPFLVYNNITYMPMTEEICDYMGLDFIHEQATADRYERLLVVKKAERSAAPEFDLIGEGDEFSVSLYEPFDGELYIGGETTRWQTFGMEYPPLRMGEVHYLPLTWKICALHFGWDYGFDTKNGLVLGCN